MTPLTKIRYHDLTDEQIAFVSNGCGPKGKVLSAPNWIFTASCDQHDINYWIGRTEADRIKADWQFYEAMLIDAQTLPWWQRSWGKFVAWSYYQSVRIFGAPFFTYGERERTLEDLVATMEIENDQEQNI